MAINTRADKQHDNVMGVFSPKGEVVAVAGLISRSHLCDLSNATVFCVHGVTILTSSAKSSVNASRESRRSFTKRDISVRHGNIEPTEAVTHQ